jgi:hypothetical protein
MTRFFRIGEEIDSSGVEADWIAQITGKSMHKTLVLEQGSKLALGRD